MAIGLIHTQSIVPTVLNNTITPVGLGLVTSRGTPLVAYDTLLTPSGFGLTASRGTPTVNGGGFATPNIINNASFESGNDNFQNGSNGSPTWIRDNTLAAPGGGSWSVKCPITNNGGSDSGIAAYYAFDNGLFPVTNAYDRLWGRFYFRQTVAINSGAWKWWRYYGGAGLSSQLGGMWQSNSGISFTFDREDSADIWQLGLPAATWMNSAWHSCEFDYMRNGTGPDGSTWPNVAFWMDGVQVTHANGAAHAESGSTGPAYWANNRLYAGARADSSAMTAFHLMGTLNGGNTTVGQCNMDLVCVSTLGRIGP